MSEFVNVQVTDGVATIRLDRPPMNAISVQVQAELRAAAATINSTPAIRAAVLYGGEKIFAAGADVKEMADANYVAMVSVSEAMHASFSAVATIPKPVVAAVTGYALGGGLELALCADFRVCGESAKFGLPEILLGIIPGGGGTQRLPRLIGPARAKKLVYTGQHIDAEEALRIGLVDRVVPDGEVYDAASRMAAQYCAGPTQALRAAKQAIDAGLGLDLDAGLGIERAHFSALFGTEDQKLGMRSFVENGPGTAHFVGR
jgi:enoyl-CoA hydratase/carnithine racemase